MEGVGMGKSCGVLGCYRLKELWACSGCEHLIQRNARRHTVEDSYGRRRSYHCQCVTTRKDTETHTKTLTNKRLEDR